MPSTYDTPAWQGTEALRLYTMMRNRYQTTLSSALLTVFFVFNSSREQVFCHDIESSIQNEFSRIDDDTQVIASWSACHDDFPHISFVSLLRDKEDSRLVRLSSKPLSIPYASHVRWIPGTPVPWSHKAKRSIRVSFIGSLDVMNSVSKRIRKFVSMTCEKWTSCVNFVLRKDVIQEENWAIEKALEIKKESVFCLEPQGESIGRRSIIDSLLLGCIPVFIDEDPYAWTKLYSHFVNMTELGVYVDPSMLSKLPSILQQFDVDIIQKRIRSHAIRLTYSLSNFATGDAGDIFASLMKQKSF